MQTRDCLFWLLLLCLHTALGSRIPRIVAPAVTASPTLSESFNQNNTLLQHRAISTELSTCGYLTGNPEKFRTANTGYNCRVDTRNGLWGFCPTTVLTASDCGLAGSCFDKFDCTDGCGMLDKTDLTTFRCTETKAQYCSIALLTFGVDQTYSYVACGFTSGVFHYEVSPTVDAKPTPTSSPSPTPTPPRSTSSPPSRGGSSSSSGSSDVSDPADGAKSTASPKESASDPGDITSNPTKSSPNSSETGSGDNSSGGSPVNISAIIGGVIGGLVVICGTTIAVIYILRRNKARRRSKTPNPTPIYPAAWTQEEVKNSRLMGGWGPAEMPDHNFIGREPVELPT